MRITTNDVVRSLNSNDDIVLPNITDPLVFISYKEVWEAFNEHGSVASAARALTEKRAILRYL